MYDFLQNGHMRRGYFNGPGVMEYRKINRGVVSFYIEVGGVELIIATPVIFCFCIINRMATAACIDRHAL